MAQPLQFPRSNPVQGEKKPTLQEVAQANMRKWLDEKRVRDAERPAREGFRGYRA